MATETFRERLGSIAFGVGWSLVCRLPEPVARTLFNWGADIAWRRQGGGVQTLEGNLLRVLSYHPGGRPPVPPGVAVGGPDRKERDSIRPADGDEDSGVNRLGADGDEESGVNRLEVDGEELRALSRAVMRSYARYYLEAFRLQVIPDERLQAGMHVNQEKVDLALEYLKNGRGVIFALPHMGDFEQAGRWVILAGAGSIVAPAERLSPESVFEKFLAFREGLGMEIVPTSGGPHPFGVMAQRLRAGKLVTIVADRDLSDTGVEVEFFGERALLPAGPAALAVQTGAALMPVACWFVGPTEWAAHVYDEIPVPASGTRKEKIAAMTQALATVFEQAIREHPEDWHMLQKLFVDDLDPERLARSRARAANGNGNGGNGNGNGGNGNGAGNTDAKGDGTDGVPRGVAT